jgi:hypothetical protein
MDEGEHDLKILLGLNISIINILPASWSCL